MTGQMDERRAHCTIFSTRRGQDGDFDSRPISTLDARRSGIRLSLPQSRAPLRHTYDVAGEQQRHEEDDLHEARPAEIAQRHRPRIQERDFDVEEQEDHRDEVELDRLPLARVADGRHAALVRRRFFRRRLARAEHVREQDRDSANPAPSPIMMRMESQPCIGESRRSARLVNHFASQPMLSQ